MGCRDILGTKLHPYPICKFDTLASIQSIRKGFEIFAGHSIYLILLTSVQVMKSHRLLPSFSLCIGMLEVTVILETVTQCPIIMYSGFATHLTKVTSLKAYTCNCRHDQKIQILPSLWQKKNRVRWSFVHLHSR